MCLKFICEWSLNSPYSMISLGPSDYGDQSHQTQRKFKFMTRADPVKSCLGFVVKL